MPSILFCSIFGVSTYGCTSASLIFFSKHNLVGKRKEKKKHGNLVLFLSLFVTTYSQSVKFLRLSTSNHHIPLVAASTLATEYIQIFIFEDCLFKKKNASRRKFIVYYIKSSCNIS